MDISAMKTDSHYIHGTDRAEQHRLSTLNALLNEASMGELRLRGTEKILDVGCGLGQLTRAMARAVQSGGHVVGVDRDPAQLGEARRQAAEHNETQLVEFRQGDVHQLPLNDDEWGSFDLVHARFVLEHVQKPSLVVQTMVRALKPSGRIILEDDDHDVLKLWPEVAAFEKVWRAYIQAFHRLGNDPFVGRRLVALLHEAKVKPTRNKILFFGSCSGSHTFEGIVANFVGIVQTALDAILSADLLSNAEFEEGVSALKAWGGREDAALWYGRYWSEAQLTDAASAPHIKASPNRLAAPSSAQQARPFRAPARRISHVQFLAESARDLNSTLNLKEVFQKIATRVHDLVDYHLFCVGVWNEKSQLLEHSYSLCYGEHVEQEGGFPLGYGISGSAAQLRQSVLVPDVSVDPRYVRYRHSHVVIRSELALPLVVKDRLVGTLDLESTEYGTFTEEHEQILSALASHIAIALDNARLYEESETHRTRLEADLATAREIQKGLLPDRVPQLPGLEIGTRFVPARELSGDFFDFLPYGENCLALAVGDVAGKATAAALYGSLTVGILRGRALEQRYTPAELLTRVSDELVNHSGDGRFVALMFGVYDAARRRLVLANSGVPYPFVVRGGDVETVELDGLPLGLPNPGLTYDHVSLDLELGDIVAICSDGIGECLNKNEECFGRQRVSDILKCSSMQSAQAIADELIEATNQFAPHDADFASDDRTVMVLKVVKK
jgi:serine phosphatase RsbU (regulator of sigma subunit)/ubiquinone/menaquinone biosynthesis C-methylase UbiE